MKNKISVIMSIYKEPIRYIDLAVKSILKQSFKNFEFIIILDNPNYREAANFLKSLEYKYKNIKILFNEKNIGLGPSLNKAIKKAKAPFIARMDADDYSISNRLSFLYSIYTTYNIDVLSSNFCFFTEEGNKVLIWKFKSQENTKEFLVKFSNFLKQDYPKHPTIFLRKKILLENPYKLSSRAQDIELFWRLKKKGYSFFKINKCLLLYRFPYLSGKDDWIKYIKRHIDFIDIHCSILKHYRIKYNCFRDIFKKYLLKKIISKNLQFFVKLYFLSFYKKINFLGSFNRYELVNSDIKLPID